MKSVKNLLLLFSVFAFLGVQEIFGADYEDLITKGCRLIDENKTALQIKKIQGNDKSFVKHCKDLLYVKNIDDTEQSLKSFDLAIKEIFEDLLGKRELHKLINIEEKHRVNIDEGNFEYLKQAPHSVLLSSKDLKSYASVAANMLPESRQPEKFKVYYLFQVLLGNDFVMYLESVAGEVSGDAAADVSAVPKGAKPVGYQEIQAQVMRLLEEEKNPELLALFKDLNIARFERGKINSTIYDAMAEEKIRLQQRGNAADEVIAKKKIEIMQWLSDKNIVQLSPVVKPKFASVPKGMELAQYCAQQDFNKLLGSKFWEKEPLKEQKIEEKVSTLELLKEELRKDGFESLNYLEEKLATYVQKLQSAENPTFLLQLRLKPFLQMQEILRKQDYEEFYKIWISVSVSNKKEIKGSAISVGKIERSVGHTEEELAAGPEFCSSEMMALFLNKELYGFVDCADCAKKLAVAIEGIKTESAKADNKDQIPLNLLKINVVKLQRFLYENNAQEFEITWGILSSNQRTRITGVAVPVEKLAAVPGKLNIAEIDLPGVGGSAASGESPYARFAKMLKIGVSAAAVTNKMLAEGLTNEGLQAYLAAQGASPKPVEPNSPVTPSAPKPIGGEASGESPYARFAKMLKMGVLPAAVTSKMLAEGLTNEELNAYIAAQDALPKPVEPNPTLLTPPVFDEDAALNLLREANDLADDLVNLLKV